MLSLLHSLRRPPRSREWGGQRKPLGQNPAMKEGDRGRGRAEAPSAVALPLVAILYVMADLPSPVTVKFLAMPLFPEGEPRVPWEHLVESDARVGSISQGPSVSDSVSYFSLMDSPLQPDPLPL